MTTRGPHTGLHPKNRPKTLGARIRAIRVAWGWTQIDLADRLNSDQPQISMYERDKAQPSRATLALLAEFFGISVQALVEGKDFSIPDLPLPKPSQRGPVGPRIQLPDIEPGNTVVIALRDTQFEHLSPNDVKDLLKRIAKKSCRTWIVLEEI